MLMQNSAATQEDVVYIQSIEVSRVNHRGELAKARGESTKACNESTEGCDESKKGVMSQKFAIQTFDEIFHMLVSRVGN